MSPQEGQVKELLDVVREFFSRIVSFFDVFDLSFFISGGMSLLGMLYLCKVLGVEVLEPPSDLLALLMTVLVAYVLGLVCFAAGRHVRRAFWNPMGRFEEDGEEGPEEAVAKERRKGSDHYLLGLLRAHRLQDLSPFQRYQEASAADCFRTLYPLLWVELRQTPALQPSFKLINSHWVRSAIFDGLIPSFLLWALTVGAALAVGTPGLDRLWVAIPLMALLVAASLWSAREAGRSDRYQMDELVATVRWWLDNASRLQADKVTPSPGPTGPSP